MTNDSSDIEIINALRQQLAEKEAENKKLNEELDKLRHAAEGFKAALWDWDVISDEIFVNSSWKTMLGFDEKQEINVQGLWESLLHPDDKTNSIQEFDDFLVGKSPIYNAIFRLKHNAGNYIWVHSKAVLKLNEQGIATRVSGALVNITEQKKAVEALSKSEKKYKALFQNSLVAIFRSKIQTGEVIDCNNKFLELLGLTNQQEFSTADYYYYPDERIQIIEELSQKGQINSRELKIKKVSGEPLWVSFSSAVYPDEGVIEVVLIDITKSKEDSLELQKVNFELDSFVYHSSHDLRSPLRSILGLINIYRHETDEYLKDEYIDRIERSINKLDHLVKELLSISRNDRINDPFVDIYFMVELDHSVEGYYNALDTDNLSLETNIKQRTKFVSDLTRVKIILNNIISNAIKYRDTSKEFSKVMVDIEVDEQEAVIKVIDNGEGIPKDQIPHIFDMFHRASDHSEGSGLGLYIVKNVIDKLNAQISVSSEQFVETIFTITIPNTLAEK